jgi:hypothetical protein
VIAATIKAPKLSSLLLLLEYELGVLQLFLIALLGCVSHRDNVGTSKGDVIGQRELEISPIGYATWLSKRIENMRMNTPFIKSLIASTLGKQSHGISACYVSTI